MLTNLFIILGIISSLIAIFYGYKEIKGIREGNLKDAPEFFRAETTAIFAAMLCMALALLFNLFGNS